MGHEKTQYGGDVVMFLSNKIIKNKKLNYPQKNVGLAHKPCAKSSKQPMVLLYMIYKPCARPPKQPMVLLYMV